MRIAVSPSIIADIDAPPFFDSDYFQENAQTYTIKKVEALGQTVALSIDVESSG